MNFINLSLVDAIKLTYTLVRRKLTLKIANDTKSLDHDLGVGLEAEIVVKLIFTDRNATL